MMSPCPGPSATFASTAPPGRRSTATPSGKRRSTARRLLNLPRVERSGPLQLPRRRASRSAPRSKPRTGTWVPDGPAWPRILSGYASISARRARSDAWRSSGKEPAPATTPSRAPTMILPGPPWQPRPAWPSGSGPTMSPGYPEHIDTFASMGPPGRLATVTRSGKRRSTVQAALNLHPAARSGWLRRPRHRASSSAPRAKPRTGTWVLDGPAWPRILSGYASISARHARSDAS